MAVDRGLWWSVNGFWGVLWLVTALAALVALGVLVVGWLRRRAENPLAVPGLPIQLDGDAVMDIYALGGYGSALAREVQERVTVTKDGKMQIGAKIVDLFGGGSIEKQVVNTYVVHAKPIDVLGVVLAALESANGIVHVDLLEQRIMGNRAWRRTRASRLSRIRGNTFVSVAGDFTLADESGDESVFVASVDDARVRMECDNQTLRGAKIPKGPFNGRCLGKVQSWDPGSEEIHLLPIAIFQ